MARRAAQSAEGDLWSVVRRLRRMVAKLEGWRPAVLKALASAPRSLVRLARCALGLSEPLPRVPEQLALPLPVDRPWPLRRLAQWWQGAADLVRSLEQVVVAAVEGLPKATPPEPQRIAQAAQAHGGAKPTKPLKLYGLQPGTLRPYRRWAVDFDYAERLSEQDKLWLDRFSREYYGADSKSLNSPEALHRGERRTECFRLQKAAERDVMSRGGCLFIDESPLESR